MRPSVLLHEHPTVGSNKNRGAMPDQKGWKGMERITLTETDLTNARDYITLDEKAEFLAEAAYLCIEKVETGVRDGDRTEPLPPMYKENPVVKELLLMGALIGLYFGKEFEPLGDTKWLMAVADYDRFAASHIMNQMERMKTSPDLRGKVFDLLKDYRNLRSMLDREVRGMIDIQNDPVERFTAAMAAQNDPETWQKQIEEVNRLMEQAQEMQKAAKEAGEGDGTAL